MAPMAPEILGGLQKANSEKRIEKKGEEERKSEQVKIKKGEKREKTKEIMNTRNNKFPS